MHSSKSLPSVLCALLAGSLGVACGGPSDPGRASSGGDAALGGAAEDTETGGGGCETNATDASGGSGGTGAVSGSRGIVAPAGGTGGGTRLMGGSASGGTMAGSSSTGGNTGTGGAPSGGITSAGGVNTGGATTTSSGGTSTGGEATGGADGMGGSATTGGASATGGAGGQPYKGVANSACADLPRLGVTWYYNWSTSPGDCQSDAEFVPMITRKGGMAAANVAGALAQVKNAGYTTVLGLNEPNKSDQANMPVSNVIAVWPSITSDPAIRVGSPCVSADARSWFEDFMDQVEANGLRVDFVTIHGYGWNAGS